MIYVRGFKKERDCPQPVDGLVIALPIVVVILLLGIVPLAAWKLYQLWMDRKKYEQFQKRNVGKVARNLSILYKNAGNGVSYVDDLNKVTEEEMSSMDNIDKMSEDDAEKI